MAETAKIIRNDIPRYDSFKFTGSLLPGCQVKSMQSSLKYRSGVITKGSSLKDQEKCDARKHV